MKKVITISIDEDEFQKLTRIATDRFDGNLSMAARHCIKGQFGRSYEDDNA